MILAAGTAVIGAGMSGAACARTLVDAGHDVVVFDKSRGVGGRLAQRRCEGAVFDHGAQFFTARDAGFVGQVDRWIAQGDADRWAIARPDGESSYIGTPSMAAPVKALLDGIAVRRNVQICRIEWAAGWSLIDQAGRRFGPFQRLAVALPAPQAAALLQTARRTAGLADALQPVVMAPCWTLLLAFDEASGIADNCRNGPIADDVLSWAAGNTTKKGRDGLDAWTVHSTAQWARDHLERSQAEVSERLKVALAAHLGRPLAGIAYQAAHRWRYAFVETPLGQPAWSDSELGLALVGDWCLGPRVEAAYLSGVAGGRALELSTRRQ